MASVYDFHLSRIALGPAQPGSGLSREAQYIGGASFVRFWGTMGETDAARKAVDQFVAEQIDTVPQLEALLMLWNSRPRQWPLKDIAQALYVSEDETRRVLHDLTRRGLISQVTGQSESYSYQPQSEEQDALLGALDSIYRKEVVRISTMIHSKASAAIREFARSFRFTKDKDKDKDKG